MLSAPGASLRRGQDRAKADAPAGVLVERLKSAGRDQVLESRGWNSNYGHAFQIVATQCSTETPDSHPVLCQNSALLK